MGFIKFLFQLAFWALVIIAAFIGLGVALDSDNPVIAFSAAGIALVVIAWKPLLILFGIYKVKEELKK